MNAIGIDIGTTTVCAVVVDVESGKTVKTVTADNAYKIRGQAFERLQDPEKIVERVEDFLRELVNAYSPVCCIGLTGQMHGVVYVNEEGRAVSPLYSWQDESANELSESGKTYAEELSEITGYPMSSGFGVSTVYVHTKRQRLPAGAKKICTIHDYAAMRLAKRKAPVVHPSDAASLGCFDEKKGGFDETALKKAGVDLSLLPEIGGDRTVLGRWENIPVAIAVGDNQASYVGAVCNMRDCLLVNIGTGSQVSFPLHGEISLPPEVERRPCTDELTIGVGASLCGGRAFAALEKFFRESAEMTTGTPVSSAYEGMNEALSKLQDTKSEWKVSTKFCGTRYCPDERGKIEGISLDNFTPQSFMLGVLQGIVDELYDTYAIANPSGIKRLIGSGNGLRKNPVLQRLFEQTFGMPLKIPAHREEAAFGAILYALVACGVYPTIEAAQTLVKYL